MSQTGYSTYETGENDVPTWALIRLAELYRTRVDYLLGLTDRLPPYPRKGREARKKGKAETSRRDCCLFNKLAIDS